MKSQGSAKARGHRKIFVGMSGGVDSSVSAALLKKAGHEVVGVFIKVWQPDWIECNWREERLEAMRAAAHLDIPFHTLDLEKEYKQGVIDYMIAEYDAGRTPNPDVMCNREVKFGGFWKWAKEQGAHAVATGHYARNENGKLLAGVDSNKDQSYFLWTLTQDDLAHVLFPVGSLTKPEVRALAKKFKLPNAEKKDSQGLCFIGKVDVKEFLAHYAKGNPAAEPGKVLNEKGEAIGSHSGALFLTIGERHGFEIDAKRKTPHDEPHYVVSKDTAQNTVTVSSRTGGTASSGRRKTGVSKTNWISGAAPRAGTGLQARTRYRQDLQSIRILSASPLEAAIEFSEPQDALTPGQSLVMYSGEECLGGGIID
jgi:tRNA-specific 2-thiouridylase